MPDGWRARAFALPKCLATALRFAACLAAPQATKNSSRASNCHALPHNEARLVGATNSRNGRSVDIPGANEASRRRRAMQSAVMLLTLKSRIEN